MTTKVRLTSMTQSFIDVDDSVAERLGIEKRNLTPEEYLVYVARVSNPQNQNSIDTTEKLLRYCFRNGHVSIFEQVFFSVEIVTSQAISAQILRHRSAVFQQFSSRYAKIDSIEPIEYRLQDVKNRQNSLDVVGGIDFNTGEVTVSTDQLDSEKQQQLANLQQVLERQRDAILSTQKCYEELVEMGIAKECARLALPVAYTTTMYMSNNVRGWIHYLEARTKVGVQKEHREVALLIKEIFIENFPLLSKALEWVEE
jgi:thymidylate synthase (FAD)